MLGRGRAILCVHITYPAMSASSCAEDPFPRGPTMMGAELRVPYGSVHPPGSFGLCTDPSSRVALLSLPNAIPHG